MSKKNKENKKSLNQAEKSKKILMIDNFKIFKNWASKTYEYKISSLKAHKNFTVLDLDEVNYNKLDDYDSVILGWNICYYSKYYTYKHDFYKKKIENLEDFDFIKIKTIPILLHNIKKYLIVQDFIHPHDYENGTESLVKYLSYYKINGIITPYLQTTSINPLRNLPIKIIHVPHHIDSQYFKEWGKKKTYDIFIFGNSAPNYYPFRYRMKKLLTDNKDKYKLLIWDKIKNYFKFNPNISNDKLSKTINTSWLTLCTSSQYNVLLGKYIETSMSGSCVLGNMPDDGRKIWKTEFVEITPEMTDAEILAVIDKALENKKLLTNRINTMKNRVKVFHLNKFAGKILDSFE